MKYEVDVSRDGRWWMISVPSIDALTQARHVTEIPLMARELVAVHKGTKLEDVEVDVHYKDINGVDGAAIAGLAKRRRMAEALTHHAANQTRALARQLVEAKVPLREVAQLIGVSHQRVHQLMTDETSEAPSPEPESEVAEVIDLIAALRLSIEAKRGDATAVNRSA